MRNQEQLRAATEADMLLSVLLAGEEPSAAIERAEAQGQSELVSSTVLPTDGSTKADVVALGIHWGPAVEGDPLFREATLPEGWSKEPTDHAMWSSVLREDGEVVARVFYKAAFYDRRAHIAAEPWCACGHNSRRHPFQEAIYPLKPCERCECGDLTA